jgi:hypothetical protein
MRLPITSATATATGAATATATASGAVGVGTGRDVGASHGLAVQDEDLALLAHRHRVGSGLVDELRQDPRAHRGLDLDGVEIPQDPADRGAVGHDRADPEPVEDGAAVSWAYSPIAANDRAPVSTAPAPSSRIASTPWRIPRACRGSGTSPKASTSDKATAGTLARSRTTSG